MFVHFPKTLGLISFAKILADLFSVPETTFLSIRKHQTLNFPYHESSRRKFPLENRRGLRAFRTDNVPKRSVGCPRFIRPTDRDSRDKIVSFLATKSEGSRLQGCVDERWRRMECSRSFPSTLLHCRLPINFGGFC